MTHIRILYLILILLTGCGGGKSETESNPEIAKAEQILAAMNCEIPADVKLVTPLLDIGDHPETEKDDEKLVREYTELFRRDPFNEGNWRLAAIMFYWSQEDIAKEKLTIESDKEFVRDSIRLRKLGQLDMDVAEMAEERQKLFFKNCNQYIKDNKKMAAFPENLIKLRTEKSQPWLNPNKKLPCFIQVRDGCYK